VTGSLTAPAGGTEGGETPAGGATEGAAEGAGATGSETTTGESSTGKTSTESTPPAGGEGGAGLDGQPAAVKQAAAALSAKTPAVQSVAFDIKTTEASSPAAAAGPPMPGPPQEGHVEAMPPDKMRLEGTGDMGGKPAKILMVMNGSKTWIQASDPDTGQPAQVITMDLSSMPGAKASGGGMPFVSPCCNAVLAQLAEETAFESVSDADLDGEACQVFEGKGTGTTTRAWFSKADGMLRRIQEADADGNVTSDTRISNIQVNPTLAAARFDYTPPDGVPVMDMAELMKQMMEGLGEAMKQGMQGMGGAAPEGATP
jgi:outer membrane lipoprotein-sorting protein